MLLNRFSNHLSANDMLNICKYYFPLRCQVITPSEQLILSLLNENQVILIPYDKDCNHEPTMKNGHKSHWAILLGFYVNYFIYQFSSDYINN